MTTHLTKHPISQKLFSSLEHELLLLTSKYKTFYDDNPLDRESVSIWISIFILSTWHVVLVFDLLFRNLFHVEDKVTKQFCQDFFIHEDQMEVRSMKKHGNKFDVWATLLQNNKTNKSKVYRNDARRRHNNMRPINCEN